MAEKRRLSADSVFGMVTLLTAVAFIAQSLQFKGASSDGVPGAGYFPIVASIFVALFSVLLIIEGIKKQNKYFEYDASKKQNLIQMLEVYGALIVFMILWNFVPFVVAALVLEVLLCRILKCSWKFTIIFSVIVVAVLYLIFNTAFRVKLDIR